MATIKDQRANSRKMNKLLMELINAYAKSLKERPYALKSLKDKLHRRNHHSHSLKN